MEEELFKISNELHAICEELERVEDKLDMTYGKHEREQLEYTRRYLLLEVERTYLERRFIIEGISKELIELFADVDVRKDKLTPPSNKNEYDLSSDYIISNKNSQKINVKYLLPYEKVKLIYEHTGEIIDYRDPVLNTNMENRFNDFLNTISSGTKKKELEKKYGIHWKEEIFKLYAEGYLNSVKYQINKIVQTVDEEKKEKEFITLNKSNGEDLKKENEQLKVKVSELETKIIDMQEKHKKSMEEIRKSVMYAANEQKIKVVQEPKEFEFTSEEKSKILMALNINLVADKDEEKRQPSLSLIQDESEPIQSIARKMMTCKYLGITVGINLNGKNFNNKNFEDESQFLLACNNTNNVIVEPTGKSI